MKTYLVPFTEKEKVVVDYIAKVEAKSKEEAYDKIIKIIDENESPHEYYDADNYGIAEHLDSCCHFDIEPFDESDIKEVDNRLSCELSYTAFDIARLGKDEIYKVAEENFLKVGIRIDIIEMDMIPIKIEECFVTYRCVPTEYKIIFSDETFIYWKDGIKLEKIVKTNTKPFVEITLDSFDIMPSLKHNSCNYDSKINILLSKSFPIAILDTKLCDCKSDVVIYNDNTYICGVFNDTYALWQCECQDGYFLINQRDKLNQSDFIEDDWIYNIRPSLAKYFRIPEKIVEERYYSFFFNN